jgi:hypothetical protein
MPDPLFKVTFVDNKYVPNPGRWLAVNTLHFRQDLIELLAINRIGSWRIETPDGDTIRLDTEGGEPIVIAERVK